MKSLSALVFLSFYLISSTSAWALQITSPVENQVFNAGDIVSVVAKPSPGEEWTGVIYGIYKMDYNALTGEYKMDIKIPNSLSGPLILTVTGVDKSGNEVELKRTIFVKLPPNVTLQSISVNQEFMVIYKLPAGSNPTDMQRIESRQISVGGLYSDGVERDLTSSTNGTTYTSSNEKIVAVGPDGKVTAQGLGTAKITVRNGKFATQVDIDVIPYRQPQR
jgi:hypothetical protein